MTRVAFAVPTLDDVKTDFWLASLGLVERSIADGIELAILNCRTSLITNSRYQLVVEALRRECDAVFFVDSDLSFPRDSLARLLAHGRPIVGATYARRREPWGVLGYGLEDVPPGATGLWKMARLPLGMALIDAKVFASMSKPWFDTEWDSKSEEFTSEDYAFCDRARAVGFEVYCDLDLSHELGHVGQRTFTWERS